MDAERDLVWQETLLVSETFAGRVVSGTFEVVATFGEIIAGTALDTED